MTELSFDVLVEIACGSVAAWRAMLAVPQFARWTLTPTGRRRAAERFRETVTDEDGTCTLLDGRRHSFWGQPAVVRTDGGQEWWRNGRVHRDGGPAIILANGYQAWYRDDRCRRNDGWVVVWANDWKEWWRDVQRYDPDAWL